MLDSKYNPIMRKKIIFPFILLTYTFFLTACSDFLDIQPTGKVIAQTGEEYRALLTSIYYNFPDDRSLTTLRTDELTLDPTYTTVEDLNSYFDIWTWNDITPDDNTVSYSWRRFYHTLYIANYIIEHQKEITESSLKEISQMVGECYMFRAYTHFILNGLFGEDYVHCNPEKSLSVPLSTQADVEVVLERNSVEEVYQQILADIDSAEVHLNVEQWENELSYRFGTLSVPALRSRVCLYMGNWEKALREAKNLIDKHPDLEDLTQTSSTLPTNYKSCECIQALEKVMKPAYKTIGVPNVAFINTYRSGDMRKSRYFKARTSRIYDLTKGGSDTERSTFRSAEAYLTAAECAARLGKKEEAIGYMKPILEKRYVRAVVSNLETEMEQDNEEDLINFIIEERHHELAYEGHRWFDLRRTTQPSIVKEYDNQTYRLEENDNRYTLPIPTEAISSNPKLSSK